MRSIPEKRIIDKCVDKILEGYINYNCHVVKLNPFNDKSKEFSIVYEGYAPWINSTKVIIQDKGIDRIFLFQIRTGYNGCYADDLFLTRTDHYLYKGELTEYPKKVESYMSVTDKLALGLAIKTVTILQISLMQKTSSVQTVFGSNIAVILR